MRKNITIYLIMVFCILLGGLEVFGFDGGLVLANRYVATDGNDVDAQGTYDAATGPATACSLTVAVKYAVGDDVIWVKNGNIAGTEAAYDLSGGKLTIANGGVISDSTYITYIGYKTTVNTTTQTSDMDLGQTYHGGGYGALTSLATAKWTVIDGNSTLADAFFNITDKDALEFRNFQFTNTAGNIGDNAFELVTQPFSASLSNCRFDNLYNIFDGSWYGVVFDNCYIGQMTDDEPLLGGTYGFGWHNCVFNGAQRGVGVECAARCDGGVFSNCLMVNGEHSLNIRNNVNILLNCTLYGASVASVRIDGANATLNAVNCIFMPDAGATDYGIWGSSDGASLGLITNNCFYATDGAMAEGQIGYLTDGTVTFTPANSVLTDPLLRDPANHDYRLRPNSPCLNAGDATLGPGRSTIGAWLPYADPAVRLRERYDFTSIYD